MNAISKAPGNLELLWKQMIGETSRENPHEYKLWDFFPLILSCFSGLLGFKLSLMFYEWNFQSALQGLFFDHYPSNWKLSKHHQAPFTYSRTHDSNCCSLSIVYCLHKIGMLCLQIISSMTAAMSLPPNIQCQVHTHSFPVSLSWALIISVFWA